MQEGEVFCLCRNIDDGEDAMIQCDECADWYHAECLGMSKREFNAAAKKTFVCPPCVMPASRALLRSTAVCLLWPPLVLYVCVCVLVLSPLRSPSCVLPVCMFPKYVYLSVLWNGVTCGGDACCNS